MSGVPVLKVPRRPGRGERRRPGRAEVVRDETQDPAERGRTIDGQPASDIEWAVYRVLRSLGWDERHIMFQVGVFGGRSFIGGGQVLDFVIETGARTVVVDVRGKRFHGPQVGKSARDRWREIQLQSMTTPPRVVVVWEDVAHSWDRLRALLLREVGAR